MKKIEFGYDTGMNPRGSWEGIGIMPNLLLLDAEYIGTVGYDNNNYVVSKVTHDEYNRYPTLVGNFIVRDAVYDFFADGSGTLFLDIEQSINASEIEKDLNRLSEKEDIKTQQDILQRLPGLNPSFKIFSLLEQSETIQATSINHQPFSDKNEAIKKCHMPITDMQRIIYEESTKFTR